MAWADNYIAKLNNEEVIQFRPRGNSMKDIINSGDLCTISPAKNFESFSLNDVVLCKVSGSQYVHKIIAVKDSKFQIGNNHGGINGWISKSSIYGKVIKVEK